MFWNLKYLSERERERKKKKKYFHISQCWCPGAHGTYNPRFTLTMHLKKPFEWMQSTFSQIHLAIVNGNAYYFNVWKLFMKHEEKLCYRMSHIASVAGFICLKKGKSYGIRFLPLSELVFFIEFQANANVKQDFITQSTKRGADIQLCFMEADNHQFNSFNDVVLKISIIKLFY